MILLASVIVYAIDENWFTMTQVTNATLPSFEPPKFHLYATDNGTTYHWGPEDIFKVPVLYCISDVTVIEFLYQQYSVRITMVLYY